MRPIRDFVPDLPVPSGTTGDRSSAASDGHGSRGDVRTDGAGGGETSSPAHLAGAILALIQEMGPYPESDFHPLIVALARRADDPLMDPRWRGGPVYNMPAWRLVLDACLQHNRADTVAERCLWWQVIVALKGLIYRDWLMLERVANERG